MKSKLKQHKWRQSWLGTSQTTTTASFRSTAPRSFYRMHFFFDEGHILRQIEPNTIRTLFLPLLHSYCWWKASKPASCANGYGAWKGIDSARGSRRKDLVLQTVIWKPSHVCKTCIDPPFIPELIFWYLAKPTETFHQWLFTAASL